MLRSQLIEILNGDPAASLTRRRAQTWCSLFRRTVRPRGYASGFDSSAALLDGLLSILRPITHWWPEKYPRSNSRPSKIFCSAGY